MKALIDEALSEMRHARKDTVASSPPGMLHVLDTLEIVLVMLHRIDSRLRKLEQK